MMRDSEKSSENILCKKKAMRLAAEIVVVGVYDRILNQFCYIYGKY